MMPRTADPEPPARPTACPFCQSPNVTTASHKIDSSTYWRCEVCGELWNAGRLPSFNRYDFRRP